MDIKEQLKLLLKEIVIDLVNGNYERIQMKLIEELEVDDLKEELSYWESLTMPPIKHLRKSILSNMKMAQDMQWNLNYG